MKKNDIALVVLIVSISLVVTYFVAKAIIGDPKRRGGRTYHARPSGAIQQDF